MRVSSQDFPGNIWIDVSGFIVLLAHTISGVWLQPFLTHTHLHSASRLSTRVLQLLTEATTRQACLIAHAITKKTAVNNLNKALIISLPFYKIIEIRCYSILK